MPYPIGTLPYPFRRRLRQLLSPAELYQLQFATGSLEDNKDLLPLQTCYSIEHLAIQKPDETTIELIWPKNYNEKVKLDGTKLYNEKTMYLTALKESDLSDLVFHHVITTNIAKLYIDSCNITKSFLERLSQKGVKPTYLSVDSGLTRRTGFTKLSQFFESFPTLEDCVFTNIEISGWVKSMADYGRTDLKMLTIWEDNFHILFDFKPVKLFQFVTAQKKGFRLRLFHVNYQEQRIANIESKVFPFLKMFFKPTDCKNASVELAIQCQDKASRYYFTPRY